MRVVRLIRQALLDLALSGGALLLLAVAIKELLRGPEADPGLLDSMLPIPAVRALCSLLIAAVLLVLWFGARSIGGARGTIVGAIIWLARVGLWWSVVALTLFIGVALYGVSTHEFRDLNWPFALGYLVLTVAILSVCAFTWRRSIVVRSGSPERAG